MIDPALVRYFHLMTKWKWWHWGKGPVDFQIRELLRAVWDLHSMYGADEPWLWRGQANYRFSIMPAVHSRVRVRSRLDDDIVKSITKTLILSARRASLDMHEGTTLPELALLALLQHHGAATPLLDVSLDPVVGLYMSVVSPSTKDDDEDGALFAIRKPTTTIAPFDSRRFATVYDSLPRDRVIFYSAPDISERLRIQRGHFLIGKVSKDDVRVTIPLTVDDAKTLKGTWLWHRLDRRGKKGAPPSATTDVGVFRIPAQFKDRIRSWLEEGTGLTREFVYPTSWHQLHLDRFAASHGRKAPL